jgi:RNA polymerase subunit RPABC4/transcription elongation factor Spt4
MAKQPPKMNATRKDKQPMATRTHTVSEEQEQCPACGAWRRAGSWIGRAVRGDYIYQTCPSCGRRFCRTAGGLVHTVRGKDATND